ncbi:glycerol-3-phosphate acyltransferase 2, mitochondrial isoform X9 [Hirundo rustica]|uniref:glycerol-3-phosphate acyltransferase 2, mitochondrial isoform X9 n=1 Tax=Hirundo rustica TaxID=43150 RepID=UPI0026737109|nr:glycerol-3-phosphate acyltransferase 2, mitochondrial isoform X9 [Hirundo rustica]
MRPHHPFPSLFWAPGCRSQLWSPRCKAPAPPQVNRGLFGVSRPLQLPGFGGFFPGPSSTSSPRFEGVPAAMTPPRIQTWISHSGPKLDVFIPFLGKYHRPVSGRCCQTCTPRSWEGFYPEDLATLGFRDVSRVRETDTRFRGWLVRRVCGFLAAWEWKIPAETPGELLVRICSSKRVQDAASSQDPGSGGDEGSQQRWKEEICRILREIQAPLSPLLLRLCHWLLPKLLTRLFLNVQLHWGQLEMVLRAARTVRSPAGAWSGTLSPPETLGIHPRIPCLQPQVPLVFLCSQQSCVDGLLLSFILLSQGIGLPRVTVGAWPSPCLRSLLQRLGGIFLPSGMAQTLSDQDEGLPGAVLDAPPQPLGIGMCLRAAFQALRWHRGCAQVDFSQPFSLRIPVPALPSQLLESLRRCCSTGTRSLCHPCPAAGGAANPGAPLQPHQDRAEPGRAALQDPGAAAAAAPDPAGAPGGDAGWPVIHNTSGALGGDTGGLSPFFLSPQPCQPPDYHSLDILDKLILGGLLEVEEPESEHGGCDVAPRHFLRGYSLGSFTDDSDSDSEHGVPKQCYKLSEPQGFPGFLLFLCRLLSPILRTYSQAVQFLERPRWPQPEADYVEALLEFLAEDEAGYPDRSLALSSLQSFMDMGVLEELQTPTGPLLQLSQPFQSASNREKLGAFIHQFTQL